MQYTRSCTYAFISIGVIIVFFGLLIIGELLPRGWSKKGIYFDAAIQIGKSVSDFRNAYPSAKVTIKDIISSKLWNAAPYLSSIKDGEVHDLNGKRVSIIINDNVLIIKFSDCDDFYVVDLDDNKIAIIRPPSDIIDFTSI